MQLLKLCYPNIPPPSYLILSFGRLRARGAAAALARDAPLAAAFGAQLFIYVDSLCLFGAAVRDRGCAGVARVVARTPSVARAV